MLLHTHTGNYIQIHANTCQYIAHICQYLMLHTNTCNYMRIHTCLSIHTNTDHIVKRHLKLASQTLQDTALTALTARGTHGSFKKLTRPGKGGDLVQNVFDAGKCLFDLLLVSCHWSIDGLGPVWPAESEPVSGRPGHATAKHNMDVLVFRVDPGRREFCFQITVQFRAPQLLGCQQKGFHVENSVWRAIFPKEAIAGPQFFLKFMAERFETVPCQQKLGIRIQIVAGLTLGVVCVPVLDGRGVWRPAAQSASRGLARLCGLHNILL